MATRKKVANKAKNMSTSSKVGIGVGITAAAVAAAGAYFLYGSKNAAKNRQMVRGWALKAKGEVLEQLEKAEEMTKEEYMQLVEKVAAGYSTLKEVTKSDISSFTKEMKNHWPEIEKTAKSTAKTAATAAAAHVAQKGVKKAAKKAKSKKQPAKKAAKKTTKKATNGNGNKS